MTTHHERHTSVSALTAPEQGTHRTFADLECLADLIADRVLERLGCSAVSVSGPLPLAWTAADVAREVGRSADWVREHRHELGLLPSSGVRPRLLFDPVAVRAWATARDEGVRSVAPDPAPSLAARRRLSPRSRTAADLIPIRDDRRAA